MRIIEFLNEQMNPAEVLGVEVPQYVGEGLQVLVPSIVGRTSTAVATKQPDGQRWDEEGFLAVVADRHGGDQAEFFKRLFDHVRRSGGHFSWGQGLSPGVSGWYTVGGSSKAVWTANAGGGPAVGARSYVYFYLPEIRRRLNTEAFGAFIAALAAIPDYRPKIDEARLDDFATKYPSLFVSDLLSKPKQVEDLFAALDLLVSSAVDGTGRQPADRPTSGDLMN